MSIVEKALSKLQNSEKPATDRRPPLPTVDALPAANARPSVETAPIQSRVFVAHARFTVDVAALQKEGVLPQQIDTMAIRNQYRRLKWPVLDEVAARRKDGQPFAGALMIASAVPGEGKTFTSCNLALSIAREEGRKVILIDCDVAKPQLTQVMGQQDRPGIMDFILQPSLTAADIMLETNFDRLLFIPAGKRVQHAAELLSSIRMQQLLQELTTADPGVVVILDTSPVLATNDAQVLARLIPQIILVVRAGSTPQPTVIEACNILGRTKTSAILNQASSWSNADSYQSDYGYGNETNTRPDKQP